MTGEVIALNPVVWSADEMAGARDGIKHILMHRIRCREERYGKAAFSPCGAHSWIIQL